MDIEYILNDCLNKAMCQKGRIQHPNSNNIADFVNNYLEAITVAHCCESDSDQLPKDKFCQVCNLPTDGKRCYSKRCPV